jgi:hypothetical protein
MSNKPIVTVNVSLQTATVSRKGFGTPIFISAHHNFPQRVRSYSSLKGVGEDFKSTDSAYIAAQGVFSNTPNVASFKVGRREADAIVTPTDVAVSSVHALTITVNDGDTLSVSVTAESGDTAADTAEALKVAIDADTAVADHVTTTVTGLAEAGILTITPKVTGDVFGISSTSGVTLTTEAPTETAGDVLTAVLEEDEDFYFVSAEDHTETFVLAMAAAVEAQTMLYFVSSNGATSLTTADSISATDTLALLKQGNFERTVSLWSQVADSAYPECTFLGVNAPYAPDERAVVWSGTDISVVLAKNALGNRLTSTQEKNLFDRNANYVTETAVGIRQLGGKTVNGSWIDDIHNRDSIVARVKEGQQALVLNQAGSKLEGGRAGVAISDAKLTENLTPFVTSKALESFTTDPSAATIDQNTRTLSNMAFEGVLSGAIIQIVINGTLVNATV